MSIANIVDRRKHQYRFEVVNAIVEAAWHDNSCKDSDQIGSASEGPDYAEREHISLADAVTWANKFEAPVTLYLYDKDGGIYCSEIERKAPLPDNQSSVTSHDAGHSPQP